MLGPVDFNLKMLYVGFMRIFLSPFSLLFANGH